MHSPGFIVTSDCITDIGAAAKRTVIKEKQGHSDTFLLTLFSHLLLSRVALKGKLGLVEVTFIKFTSLFLSERFGLDPLVSAQSPVNPQTSIKVGKIIMQGKARTPNVSRG